MSDAASRQVVVIGGGIIGSSTAYFLKKRGNVNVTIVEGSSIAAGASGKAGGLLAYDWTEGQPTESLTKLSYKLHQDLAKEFGADTIGHRPLTTISLAIDTVSNRGKKVPGAEWINNKSVSQSSKLGDERTTAQVHPRLLTQKLAESADKIIYAQAEKIETGTDGRPSAVIAKDRAGHEVRVDCTDVVVTAGPWSGQLVKKLFKHDSQVDASDYHIVGSRAHSIVLKSSLPLSAMACFTSIRTGKNTSEPELYCRPDGTGYLCGPTDDSPIPEKADQVDINPQAIKKLKAEAIMISPEALGEKAEVVAEQACFLPISRSTGSPILSKLKEGTYFAAGHSCWGILQGPATGLAMSELIFDGKVSCCDVSELIS